MILCVTLLAVAMPVQAADPPAFEFAHAGAAGDWLVLNVPLAEQVDEFEREQSYELTATAPADRDGNLLFFPLDLLADYQSFPGSPFEPPEHRTVPAGESVTLSAGGHWSSSVGGGVFVSMAVAVASDVPFTLEVTIDPDEGFPALGAPLVNMGTGTSVQTADELLGTPVGPVDQIQLEGTFASAGWHHVQIEFDYVQPNGARTYEVNLPTQSWEGVGTIRGYNTGLVGSAGSSGMIDMMGAFADTAGDFSIDLTYAQASWDVDVYVYEMPGGFTLPTGWSSGYAENEWPFWDCFSCPPLPDL